MVKARTRASDLLALASVTTRVAAFALHAIESAHAIVTRAAIVGWHACLQMHKSELSLSCLEMRLANLLALAANTLSLALFTDDAQLCARTGRAIGALRLVRHAALRTTPRFQTTHESKRTSVHWPFTQEVWQDEPTEHISVHGHTVVALHGLETHCCNVQGQASAQRRRFRVNSPAGTGH